MTAVKASVVDNPDIVLYAVYLTGGAGGFVDVEDIAVKCFELAPERFGFRRHPYPNYKTFAKALRDYEGKRPEDLIRTPDGLMRQLSPEGLKRVKRLLPVLERVFGTRGANPPTRRRNQRVLNEFRDHPIAQAYLSGAKPALSKFDVADLLMCAPDSPTDEWDHKAKSIETAAIEAGRPDLASIVREIRDEKPEWFGGS